MRYVVALATALLPSVASAWTCAYVWEDSTPVYGVFPGKAAVQETRLKLCYTDLSYSATVEQRFYHTVKDGAKDVDQEIAGWHVLTSEELPRSGLIPGWKNTWQEGPKGPSGWGGGGY